MNKLNDIIEKYANSEINLQYKPESEEKLIIENALTYIRSRGLRYIDFVKSCPVHIVVSFLHPYFKSYKKDNIIELSEIIITSL